MYHIHYTSLRLFLSSRAIHIWGTCVQEWKINTVYPGININSSDTFKLHAKSDVYEKSKRRDVYSGCDTLSLRILFVYFLALPSLLHPSILFNCFFILVLYRAWSATDGSSRSGEKTLIC